MLQLNQNPYFDDFSITKDFYRILFRPSVAVQARELTQIQSILQNQFKSFGDNIFQNGSMVLPGHLTYDNKLSYVKLEALINGVPILLSTVDPSNPANTNTLPILITGSISGLNAQVISIFPATGGDPDTLYVKYLNSGIHGEKAFLDNEFISLVSNTTIQLYQVAGSGTGFGSAISIAQGVYYINGIFCAVFPQTLILDKYDNTPSFRMGLTVVENIVTSLTDPTLLDNATGSPNFAAPGADRYQIVLTLDKLSLNSTADTNFVELARVDAGQLQFFVENTEYSIIGDAIASNIYNINGNFTVNPFKLDVIENINGNESLLSIGLEPGKAYVGGNKIKTIATTYVDVPKARTTAATVNGDTRAYLGNYCLVDTLYEFPTYDSYVTLGLYDTAISSNGSSSGTQIGTADIRAIEYNSGTIGTATAVYKFFLFNIQMNAGKTFNDVESFYVVNGGSFVASTGNILSQLYVRSVIGSFTVGETITGSDSNTAVVIEWDPINSLLTTQPSSAEIAVGVSITGGTSSATANISSRTKLFNPQSNVLIYALPQQVIQTIRSVGDTIQTTYKVRETFTANITGGSASFSTGPNEVFVGFNEIDYIVTMQDGASAGDIIDISGSVVFSGIPANSTITFTCPNGHVKLSATVLREIAQEKTKTLVSNAQVSLIAVTPPTVQASKISLAKADIYQLVSVVDSLGHDITSNYTLDNGQRDDRYDVGSISLNPGASNTSLALTITFDYFNHGQGDYFSVDSYTNFITNWYENIPTYTSIATGTIYLLRDSYDFRPRANDNGIGFNTSSGKIVKINDDILADFEFYLPRADKVYLNTKGEFLDIQGTPSLSPQPPADPKDGMVLYVLNLPAYTFHTTDVTNQYIDNKRYTMRDIGKLEARISNIEYYTSLNLLEQQTVNLSVQDAATGLDRFKNGFLVDNFNSFTVADVYNADFHASLDTANQIMRPEYFSNAINLTFDQVDSTNFEYQGKKPNNTLVSLPYNEIPFISQTQASDVININPFAIYAWIGNMSLTPPTDIWKDTDTRPVILINNDIGFDNITGLLNPGEVLGTMYGEWETDWTGYTDLGQTFTYGQAPNVTNVAGNPATSLLSETQTTQATLHQSRQAITTSIQPQVVSTQIQNKVLNVSYATFIRNNQVLFQATGMKPRTQVYAFFDTVNVSAFCKPQGSINGTYSDPSTTLGQPLVTDASGAVNGWFNIPDDPSTDQFKCGSRVFIIIDSQTSPTDVNSTTFSAATYTASGLLETDQETIISTRVPEVVQSSVTQTQTSVQAPQSQTYTNTTYMDPLAQSFLISGLDGGTFITSVDIYFYTKDPSIPVTLSIREMENGLPTQTIVPLSIVTMNPSNINLSLDGSVATTFSFPSPVYLQNNTEYAIVLMSNSNSYNVYIATLGHNIINSDRVISQQPYNGVLFESKNSSTWTPNQTSDLTFVLRRAQFNTSVASTIIFTNPVLPVRTLPAEPFQTVNTSPFIRVFHPNHGMNDNSTVTLTIPQVNWVDTYNGIPVSSIVPVTGPSAGTANFLISNVTFDSYVITASSNANASGAVGPAGFTVSEDRRMDTVYPIVQQLTFSTTETDWSLETTTTRAINGSQSAYNKDTVFSPIPVNENIELDVPRAILSNINEQTTLVGTALQKKSFVMQAVLSTTVDNLSPIIDTTRIGVITISNRCGQATPQNTNLASFDELDYIFTGTDIAFNATDNSISSSTTDFSKVVPYSYITVSGSTSGLNDVDFNHAILVTSVAAHKLLIDPSFTITAQVAGPSVTVSFFNNFIDEKSPNGSSQVSKYICRPITLAQAADSLQLYLATLLQTPANATIYYRVIPEGSNALIGNQPYAILPIDPSINTTISQSSTNFIDYDWLNDTVGNYLTVAIKVVMNTTDTTKVPQFQAFRALALSL